ncbi:RHS repeat-associated core domain-containing protein [Arhodomonas sp. AD133]|uniref:RHS repeat-associated core domain-containing protein n=1 Tax=Arhodomonas sp. AD133 TaxID=3415009 RepID=UPI003EBFC831
MLDHHGQTAFTVDYDGEGRIARLTDRTGRTVTYHYDADGALVRVTDVRGEDWRYTYDTLGDERVLTSRTDPDDRVTEFRHKQTGGGQQCVPTGDGTWVVPDGQWRWNAETEQWEWDGASGQVGQSGWQWNGGCTVMQTPSKAYLAAIADAHGVRKSFRYTWDRQGKRYMRATREGGQITQVVLDHDGRVVKRLVNGEEVAGYDYGEHGRTKQDANGHTTRTDYDRWRNPIRIVHPDESTERFRYNDYAQVTRHVDERGIVTRNEYDDHGNLVRRVEAVGTDAERVTEFAYDAHGQLVRRRLVGDAHTAEAVTTTTYDDYGNVTSRTDPEGHTTRYRDFDALGNARVRIDRRGERWTRTFDAAGNRTSRTDPLDRTTKTAYDGAGHRVSVTDAANRTTTYHYDDAGLLTRITDPAGGEVRLAYAANRQVRRIVDASGQERRLTYTAGNRRKTLTDGLGNTITYHYGGEAVNAGRTRLARIEYPTYTERYRYDRRGRKVEVTRTTPAGRTETTHYTYDAAGNRTSVTDNADRTTRYTYDALGRRVVIEDPTGHTVRYAYDDADNLRAVTNQRGVVIRRFAYNRRGEKTRTVWPDGETWRYAYTPTGELKTQTDAKGQRTVHSYDAAGRRTATAYYPDTATDTPARRTTFEYTDTGKLAGYDNGTTSATYAYDRLDRRTATTVDFGPFTKTFRYAYTANGQKEALTYPGGDRYGFRYNDAGLLTGIDFPDGAHLVRDQFQWHKPGRVLLPGGGERHFTYDGFLRPTRIRGEDPADATIMDYRYTYNDAGNITVKATEHGRYAYTYDRLDRLTDAENPTLADEHYTYDPAGNRLTSADTEGEWRYNAANQLLGYDDVTFTYDANGSTITRTDGDQTTRYAYNLNNRLARLERPDGLTARYAYDPFGRRLWKDVDGERTYFLYADEGLIAEYDESGTLIQRYGFKPNSTWGTDPVWTEIGGKRHYYHNDHIGAPRVIAQANGAKLPSVLGRAAFGEGREFKVSSQGSLRFPGQFFDYETVLDNNYYRYYYSEIGRYFSSDPIGIRGGLNTYVYANNDPVRHFDPLGLMASKPPAWLPPPGYPDDLKKCGPKTRDALNMKCQPLTIGEKGLCVELWRQWKRECILYHSACMPRTRDYA